MYVGIYVYIYSYIRTHAHTHTHIYIHSCCDIYVYACIYIYIYMYYNICVHSNSFTAVANQVTSLFDQWMTCVQQCLNRVELWKGVIWVAVIVKCSRRLLHITPKCARLLNTLVQYPTQCISCKGQIVTDQIYRMHTAMTAILSHKLRSHYIDNLQQCRGLVSRISGLCFMETKSLLSLENYTDIGCRTSRL
jgi:hypothetical protein